MNGENIIPFDVCVTLDLSVRNARFVTHSINFAHNCVYLQLCINMYNNY